MKIEADLMEENKDLIDKIGFFDLEEIYNRLYVNLVVSYIVSNFLSFCWIIFHLSCDVSLNLLFVVNLKSME
jgi:hypothetical protein